MNYDALFFFLLSALGTLAVVGVYALQDRYRYHAYYKLKIRALELEARLAENKKRMDAICAKIASGFMFLASATSDSADAMRELAELVKDYPGEGE